MTELLEQRLLLTETNIPAGILSAAEKTFNDSVQNTDVDRFHFQLNSASTFKAAFSGVADGIFIQLVQDLNGNDQIDNGEVLETRSTAGPTFSMSEPLSSGDYMLVVSPYNATDSTTYTLKLSALAIAGAQDAGDELADARNAGVLTPLSKTFTDVIQNGDVDVYRFQLSAASTVSATFTGLDETLYYVLVQDLNGNNQIDSGETFERGANTGQSLTLTEPLSAGEYFIQIVSYNTNDNTAYTLGLSAVGIVGAQDAGDAMASARNAGVLTAAPTSLVDTIQGNDVDVYRFELSAASTVTATFTGLSETVYYVLVRDLNGNDQIDAGETYEIGSNSGATQTLIEPLSAGAYFIQIVPYNTDDNSAYSLTLSTVAIPGAQDAGDTIATALNMGVLAPTASKFVDVIQNGDVDVYHFQLTAASTVTATFTGLSETVYYVLVQDLNGNNQIDSGEHLEVGSNSGQTSTIVEPLSSGDYFIQLVPYNTSDNTAYTLTVSALAITGAQDAGSTLATAKNAGPLTRHAAKFVDVIQNIDTDTYRFQLSATSLLTATFTGLSETIYYILVQDLDGNNQIDSGETIKPGSSSGATSSLLQTLPAGEYFLQVFPYNASDNTSYTLSLNSNIAPQPPTIVGFGGTIAYTENQLPLLLDTDVVVADVDSLDFDTGSVTIGITTNADAGDRLEIVNQGSAAGEIGVSGAIVTYGGTTIGTFTGGDGISDLVVTLNENANPMAVQALLRSVTYRSISESPSTATRGIRVFINDGDGETSSVSTKNISITAVNDVPEAKASIVTTSEDTPKAFKVSDFLFTDAEQNALSSITISGLNLANGDTLTVDQGAGPVAVSNGMTITAARISALVYSPVVNANGLARSSFDFKVNDVSTGIVSATMSINVAAVNDSPTDVTLSSNSVGENSAPNTTIGTLTGLDVDAVTVLTYSLVPGAGSVDNASFAISGSTLKIIPSADFETRSSYSIRIRATDQGNLFVEKTFTISVTNVNDAPTNITLSAASIMEGNAPNALIGSFSAVDADAGESFTYTLVTGIGSSDNGSFTLAGNVLKISPVASFADKSSYSIRVQVADSSGAKFEKQFTINVTKFNHTPVDISLSSQSVAGNLPAGTTVGVFNGTDPDVGDTFSYDVAAGTGDDDNSKFTISNGQLKTAAIFHMHAKSSYSILVRATDQGGLSFTKPFTITVTEGSENPTDIALTSSTIAENQPAATAIGAFSSTDPNANDTFTYSLAAGPVGTDNANFTILNGQLRTASIFNFEAKNTYSILVRTTDQSGLAFDKQFTISVTDSDDAPTDVALSSSSILEGQSGGSIVGTFNSADPDVGNTFIYSLVSGSGSADNGSFTVVNGELMTVGILDFEVKKSYSIRVRTTDQGGLTFERPFTISVIDGIDAPTDITLTATSFLENQPSGSTIGTFNTTSQNSGSSFTYFLVSGIGSTDNAKFTIANGQLKSASIFDFESKSSYSILVRTVDQANQTFDKQFTIQVTNANEAPTQLTVDNTSILENQPFGAKIGTFETGDPDNGDTFTYSLVPGPGSTDNLKFFILNDQLRASGSFDFEAKNSYEIHVRVTDQGGLAVEKPFTVSVTDTSDAPTDIMLSAASVAENLPAGSIVGLFSSSDPDLGNTFTYALVAGPVSTDNGSFTISNGELCTSGSFDFETKKNYAILVRSTDQSGLTFEKPFTIVVTNVNETPTNLLLSSATVAENQAAGTKVGTLLSTDPDAGNTFTYSLVSGAGSVDNNSFMIQNGQLQTLSSFDYESQSTYSIRLRTTDQNGLSFEGAMTVNVSDVNESPVIPLNQSFTIAENSITNTAAGMVMATDPDKSGPFNIRNFRITSGNTDSAFAINSTTGELIVNNPAMLDFETKSVFSLEISLADGAGGNAIPTLVTVHLTDVNEVPTITSVSDQTIAEDGSTGNLGFSVSDPESIAPNLVIHATSSNQNLIPDANLALFGTDTVRRLVATPLANQFGAAAITLSVSDGSNVSTTTFLLTVTSVPDAPTVSAFQSQSIQEDSSTGPLAFMIHGDGNLNVTATSSNTAVISNAGLTITGTGANRSLVVTPIANQNGSAVITVTVDDGVLTSSQQFTVTINPVDDPTVITLAQQPLSLPGSTKTAVPFDGTATLTDVDGLSSSVGGATLRISGQSSKDQLSILKQNGISTKGKSVLYNGVVIGTVDGGIKGSPLTIRLTAAATQSAVQGLIRGIGFKPDKRTLGNRTMQVQLSNGGIITTATRQVQIHA